jgi:hypothetical protein
MVVPVGEGVLLDADSSFGIWVGVYRSESDESEDVIRFFVASLAKWVHETKIIARKINVRMEMRCFECKVDASRW